MDFISQNNSISLSQTNILFNPYIDNPFFESHLKYIQIFEDSINKKKLNMKN